MQSVVEMFPGTTVRTIMQSPDPLWSCNNPSVARGPNDEIKCIVRSANYIYRDGQFICTAEDGMVRTRNYLCDLTDTLDLANLQQIDDSAVDPPLYPWVQNLEDARLYYHDGSWWACGTSRQHRADGLPQMALDRLEGNVVAERTILGAAGDKCEKNWVPILGTLQTFMYSAWPAAVYDMASDTITEMRDPISHRFFSEPLRGGTQLIPVSAGCRICLTHEVTWEPDRHYWHRFLLFSAGMHLVGATRKFYFVGPGCEFAAGIIKHGDDFVVSFGHAEERAMLAVIPRQAVYDILT